MEDSIASIRHKSVRSAYLTAWFLIGMGLVFAASAVFFHQELRAFPLTVFVGGSAIGCVLGGLCYLWIAVKKR